MEAPKGKQLLQEIQNARRIDRGGKSRFQGMTNYQIREVIEEDLKHFTGKVEKLPGLKLDKKYKSRQMLDKTGKRAQQHEE